MSFAEAATVFADAFAVYLDDGSGVGQLVVIGASVRDRVRYVVHVERGTRDRIVSARPATTAERDVYETGGSSLNIQSNGPPIQRPSPFVSLAGDCGHNAVFT